MLISDEYIGTVFAATNLCIDKYRWNDQFSSDVYYYGVDYNYAQSVSFAKLIDAIEYCLNLDISLETTLKLLKAKGEL